jgi:hypothetical protein
VQSAVCNNLQLPVESESHGVELLKGDVVTFKKRTFNLLVHQKIKKEKRIRAAHSLHSPIRSKRIKIEFHKLQTNSSNRFRFRKPIDFRTLTLNRFQVNHSSREIAAH